MTRRHLSRVPKTPLHRRPHPQKTIGFLMRPTRPGTAPRSHNVSFCQVNFHSLISHNGLQLSQIYFLATPPMQGGIQANCVISQLLKTVLTIVSVFSLHKTMLLLILSLLVVVVVGARTHPRQYSTYSFPISWELRDDTTTSLVQQQRPLQQQCSLQHTSEYKHIFRVSCKLGEFDIWK